MYPVKSPYFIQKLFPEILWKGSVSEKKIYLTFDDGPQEGITELALEILKQYKAKATFFCVGKEVKKNPKLYERIRTEGHSIGNHSYSHPNGWKTNKQSYLEDVKKAAEIIDSQLFRPPYGKLSFGQYRSLKKKYKIVLWDVVAGDFEREWSKEKCYRNISENVEAGSIIVLHDNIRFKEKMLYCLEMVLDQFGGKGFEFCKL